MYLYILDIRKIYSTKYYCLSLMLMLAIKETDSLTYWGRAKK